MKLFAPVILMAQASLMQAADPAAAALAGRVTDVNGAAVPGAVVVLREADGLAHRRVTDETGFFNFESLTPSTYNVRISKPGFRAFETAGFQVQGHTALNRRLTTAGPARVVAAAAQEAPDITGLLEEGLLRAKWAHVKLAPEFRWQAPASDSPMAEAAKLPRLAYGAPISEMAKASYFDAAQLAPALAQPESASRAAWQLRVRF